MTQPDIEYELEYFHWEPNEHGGITKVPDVDPGDWSFVECTATVEIDGTLFHHTQQFTRTIVESANYDVIRYWMKHAHAELERTTGRRYERPL